MGTADIITDLLLVCFPIPIVLRSQMPLKRKLSSVCLFSFSLALIVITGMRMPHVISHHGRQQYRTVWASAEILASAAVSNAVILGSFVRDRGVKKNKYRRGSALDSLERADTRRTTITSHHRDSEEALFREIGCRMPKDLRNDTVPLPRPAPAAISADAFRTPAYRNDAMMTPADLSDSQPSPHDSADALRKPSSSPPSTGTGGSVSLFDVGGLLGSNEAHDRSNGTTSYDFAVQDARPRTGSQRSHDVLSELGGRLSLTRTRSRRVSGGGDQPRPRPRQSRDERSVSQQRAERENGNALSLQDVGGLLASNGRGGDSQPVSPTSPAPTQQDVSGSPQAAHRRDGSEAMSLQDVGGLLK